VEAPRSFEPPRSTEPPVLLDIILTLLAQGLIAVVWALLHSVL